MTQLPQRDGADPQAMVREIKGELVLDDPVLLIIALAVEKLNCKATLELNLDRVAHFNQRFIDRGLVATEVVIVIINVDDAHGGLLAEKLMPGTDWQQFRDRGEVPFARGLAQKDGIVKYLAIFDEEAAEKLRKASNLAVVVIDFGVAEVFLA